LALFKKGWVNNTYCTFKNTVLLVTLSSRDMNRDIQNHLFLDTVHSLSSTRTEI